MYFKNTGFVCYKYLSTKYVKYLKLVDYNTINSVDLSQHESGMPKTGMNSGILSIVSSL
jgi:hypothetical protein